jgi:hypothetical protein
MVSPRARWAGLVVASLGLGLGVGLSSGWDPWAADVAPGPVLKAPEPEVPGLARSRERMYDPFPPLVRFAVVAARDAGDTIADDEFVLGAEVGGEARAYPLNMLGHPGSEVVNDTLGGEPIAVTFCGLCETPLVFSRRVDDRTLTFHVSGIVVESNMLIRDVETRSGWIQLLGEAIEGPLKGEELRRFPSVWTDWKTWRAAHPGTTAVSLARGSRKYSRSTVSALSSLERVHEAFQWGLARDGRARSWPFPRLAKQRAVNDSFGGIPLLITFDPQTLSPVAFDRRLDGRALTFRRRGDDLVDEATGSRWDPVTGLALGGPLEGRRLPMVAGTIATTRTWRAFHPDGEIWDPDAPPSEREGRTDSR